VETRQRQGRKMVTTVSGLEMFDVKLEDAAKKFKKKFACGSAVQKASHAGITLVRLLHYIQGSTATVIISNFNSSRPDGNRGDSRRSRSGSTSRVAQGLQQGHNRQEGCVYRGGQEKVKMMLRSAMEK
jgi:translation initiation factor 1 (eIF-1/SUI1)